MSGGGLVCINYLCLPVFRWTVSAQLTDCGGGSVWHDIHSLDPFDTKPRGRRKFGERFRYLQIENNEREQQQSTVMAIAWRGNKSWYICLIHVNEDLLPR